jgi:DNA-binding LytR/AlgR family response regulator
MEDIPVTIAVCEDEKNIRDEIGQLLRKHIDCCCVDCFEDAGALFKTGKRYDIYIMDIQMSGLNGMDAARKIKETTGSHAAAVIFVTAFKEYMQDAFDVRAYHFLLKPIDEKKFVSVLSGAVGECRENASRANIFVKNAGVSHVVPIDDILFIESRNKKVVIHTKGGRIEYYGRIGDFDGNPAFYRCHRCYFVNMGHITRYDSKTIWLSDGRDIFLAAKKYPEFVKAFMKYMVSWKRF